MLNTSKLDVVSNINHRANCYSVVNPRDKHLLIIPISPRECQSFLLSEDLSVIYVDESPWKQDQIILIETVLKNRHRIIRKEIHCHTFLLGVWHFGHLLGDHGYWLVKNKRRSEGRPIFEPRPLQSFNLFRQCGLADIQQPSLSCETPWLIRLGSECEVHTPIRDPIYSLALVQEEYKRLDMEQSLDEDLSSKKVFLTSDKVDRIANIKELKSYLRENGWLVIKAQTINLAQMKIIEEANILLSENGSILFNLFMTRNKPYFVLSSDRVKWCHSVESWWLGGGVYNKYHEQLITHITCAAIMKSYHPYSDQLFVDQLDLEGLLP